MHHHSPGLVYNYDVIVFVYNIKVYFFRRYFKGLGLLNPDIYFIAGLKLLSRLGRFSADCNISFFNKFGNIRPGII